MSSFDWEGIIFDLDGVICHTDEFHYQAWKQISDRLGIRFDEEINLRLRGVSRAESLEIILENYKGMPLNADQKEDLLHEKNCIYRSLLGGMNHSDLSVQVYETLNRLKECGLHLAIGSSSRNADYILRQIGLNDFFEVIIDGNKISHSKPHPEVFEKAAMGMGLEAAKCLVVEDAEAGIQAGQAAHMKVACLGEVSRLGKGDYNLHDFSDLIKVVLRQTETKETNA